MCHILIRSMSFSLTPYFNCVLRMILLHPRGPQYQVDQQKEGKEETHKKQCQCSQGRSSKSYKLWTTRSSWNTLNIYCAFLAMSIKLNMNLLQRWLFLCVFLDRVVVIINNRASLFNVVSEFICILSWRYFSLCLCCSCALSTAHWTSMFQSHVPLQLQWIIDNYKCKEYSWESNDYTRFPKE